jgi:FkbM family methyltransferase
MNERGRWWLVLFIKIVLGVAVTVYAVVMVSPSPKPRLAVLWAVRRAGGCSVQETIRSGDFAPRIARMGDEFNAASRVLQEDAGLVLVATPRGNYWAVKNDKFLRFTLAEQELEIYGKGGQGVRPGDVVLDCGANVGVFTRTALSRGARLVVAIEPAPVPLECLRRNFQKEIAGGQVIVCPKGVWDHQDTLDLVLGEEGNTTGNSFVLGRGIKRTVKVPLTTIDILVQELHLDRVDFIKMDIEGSEKPALRGAAQTIKKFSPRLAIASEHLPDDPTRIPETVNTIRPGYKITATHCQDYTYSVAPEVLLFGTGTAGN